MAFRNLKVVRIKLVSIGVERSWVADFFKTGGGDGALAVFVDDGLGVDGDVFVGRDELVDAVISEGDFGLLYSEGYFRVETFFVQGAFVWGLDKVLVGFDFGTGRLVFFAVDAFKLAEDLVLLGIFNAIGAQIFIDITDSILLYSFNCFHIS
jgi:hypothetical protein